MTLTIKTKVGLALIFVVGAFMTFAVVWIGLPILMLGVAIYYHKKIAIKQKEEKFTKGWDQ